MKHRGVFITLEGIEGCGKTTQARTLAAWFRRQGREVLLLSEPGGTRVSEAVRSILLYDREHVHPVAEAFLFLASRAQLVRRVIQPALRDGVVVVCDRFMDSTIAYQGYGRGLSLPWLHEVNRVATGGLKPDRTLLLTVPVEVGLRRARRKGNDRIQREHLAFHKRVARGFLALARREPRRFRVISILGSRQETAKAIQTLVGKVGLGKKKRG